MTKKLTNRLPAKLASELKARTTQASTNPSEVLRQAAADYGQRCKPAIHPMQKHILARAGTWDGDISGMELLRRSRP